MEMSNLSADSVNDLIESSKAYYKSNEFNRSIQVIDSIISLYDSFTDSQKFNICILLRFFSIYYYHIHTYMH